MNPSLLHVVCCIFNPVRWASRDALYRQFEQEMLDSGVKLTTVECQLGERPFLYDNPHVNNVKVRCGTLLWNKENLINLGIASISTKFPDWKYVGTFDADIKFRNAGWATEAVHALQQYYVIQPWAKCLDLGPNGQLVYVWNSFCKQFVQDAKMSASANANYTYAHSGYAWCYTRQAIEWLGGLLETAALGAGDHHMAWSLLGHADWTIPVGVTEGYRMPIKKWEAAAVNHIHQRIGCLDSIDIEHSWHGPKNSRGYRTRWSIIIENKFDPFTDTKKNVFGVLELSGNKPKMEHQLDRYMRLRAEDANIDFPGNII